MVYDFTLISLETLSQGSLYLHDIYPTILEETIISSKLGHILPEIQFMVPNTIINILGNLILTAISSNTFLLSKASKFQANCCCRDLCK